VPQAVSAPEAVTNAVSSSQPRVAKPRREFSRAQKQAILAEAECCTERGDIGALLRRHGIYSAALTKWRQALQDPSPRSPGRPSSLDPKDQQITELQRRIEQLEVQNKRDHSLLELQKKVLAVMNAAAAVAMTS